MELIHITNDYPLIFDNILTYLGKEDKRKLFFTSNKLQVSLLKYPSMKTFTNNLQLQILTFYFPKLTHGKKGPLRSLHRTSQTTTVNAHAIKIQCTHCKQFYYNANYESQITNCTQHSHYSWSNENMYISKRGQDLLGIHHTTKQCFKPIGNNRRLCYCKICNSFIHYQTGEGITNIVCYTCRRHQQKSYANKNPVK